MEPLAKRHVIVVRLGELEQYSRSGARHRVRPLVVHLLANGRRFLQVQLVAGRYQERALGQKVARVGQLRRTVVVHFIAVAAVVVVCVPQTSRPSVVRAVTRGLIARGRRLTAGRRGAHTSSSSSSLAEAAAATGIRRRRLAVHHLSEQR